MSTVSCGGGAAGYSAVIQLWPDMSWYLHFRVEYLAIPAIVVLVTLVLKTVFPCVQQKAYRVCIYAVSGVMALLALFADTVLLTEILFCYYIVIAAAIVYTLVRLAMKSRRPDTEQTVTLAALGVVFVSAILDMLYYGDVIFLPMALTETSMLIFALFEMVAIFHGTMREVEAAKEREQKLAFENATLEELSARIQALLRRAEQKPG